MNKRRLLKLADLLEADARKKKGIKFDLHTFAKPADCSSRIGLMAEKPKALPLDCNTAACALGLAALSGVFKKPGFTYTIGLRGGLGRGYFVEPKFGRWTNFKAAEKFFDIKHSVADWFFNANSYDVTQGAKAERAVAKRIRDFVAGKAAP